MGAEARQTVTDRRKREAAIPSPFEWAVVVVSVLVFILLSPSTGTFDLVPRLLCLVIGAGTLAMCNEYRLRRRRADDRRH